MLKRWILLPLLTASLSCDVLNVYSDPVTGFHGESQLDVITGPDQVQSYRLDPYSYGSKERGRRFAGYLLVEEGPGLSERQQIELTTLFLDEANYGFEFDKACDFLPGVGLRFIRGGKKVDMLICFSCNEWEFHHEDRVVGEDFHRRQARPKLAVIAKRLFPDDIVIRNLRTLDD